MNKIYILLPVYNRKEVTRRFIECLQQQTYADYHLVLIDDGSQDGTAEMVRERISSLTVITGRGSWWWAGCLQQGLNWLKQRRPNPDDIILFMNDDVTFDTAFLQTAVVILQKKIRTLLLPQICDSEFIPAQPIESGVEADLKRLTFKTASSPDRINCFPTRGLFARWSEVLSLGNFHSHMLPHYLSDYEFTIRAWKKRFHFYTTPELVIRVDDQTTGYHSFEEMRFFQFLKRFFSKKSAANPIYWTTFVILVSPKCWILPNIMRVWKNAAKTVLIRSFTAVY